MALRLRRLKLQGVTTDASPLYPEPLHEVFGDVPHQICEFHIIKELTKAILRAVAKVRKKLAACGRRWMCMHSTGSNCGRAMTSCKPTWAPSRIRVRASHARGG